MVLTITVPLKTACSCPCGAVIKKIEKIVTFAVLSSWWNMFVSVQLHILGDPLCSVGEFYNKDCNSKLPPVRSHLDGMCLSVYSCIYWATPKCSPGELYNKDCNSKIPPVRSLPHSLSLSLTPSLSHALYHPDITVMVDWAYNTKLLSPSPSHPLSLSLSIDPLSSWWNVLVSVQLRILGNPLCSVGEFYNKDCNSKLPPVRSLPHSLSLSLTHSIILI